MNRPLIIVPSILLWISSLLIFSSVQISRADVTTTTTPQSLNQLTIYNQLFAVVKERRTVDLKSGLNEVRVSDVTAHVEPESVIVGSLTDPDAIKIAEQNYEGD